MTYEMAIDRPRDFSRDSPRRNLNARRPAPCARSGDARLFAFYRVVVTWRMPRAGSMILSDFPPGRRLELTCARCDRRGSYAIVGLMARYGDIGLVDLLHRISAVCPRRAAAMAYDQCGAQYVGLT
jgi:hypothetical protein